MAPPAPPYSVHGRRRRDGHDSRGALGESRGTLGDRAGRCPASRGTTRCQQAASAASRSKADAQSVVELFCECTQVDCERELKVPLYVYRRMLESDQYLLQAGHHAFPQYRTIISIGLMRIEERI